MTERLELLGIIVAVAIGASVVAAAFGGLPTVLGLQHDSETATAGFSAGDDLTVTVENRSIAPAAISTNDPGNVTISFPIQFPNAVNESRISVSLANDGAARRIDPATVTCDDRCTVVVSGRDVVRLATGPGDYEVVVRGWWEYDRLFVVTVPLTVERPDPAASGNGTASDPTTNSTGVQTATTTGSVNGTTTSTTETTNGSSANTSTSTTTTNPKTEHTTRTSTTESSRTTTETTAGTSTTTTPTTTNRTTRESSSTTSTSTTTGGKTTTERTTERTTRQNETAGDANAARTPTRARVG